MRSAGFRFRFIQNYLSASAVAVKGEFEAFTGPINKFKSDIAIAMLVASCTPGNGTLQGFATGGVTADMSQWSAACEFMTDSDVVEFACYQNNARPLVFQVDGQYVDRVGTVGAGAGNAWLPIVRATEQDTPIVVLGAGGGIRNNSAGVLANEQALSDGVAAWNDPLTAFAKVSSADTPWISGTGYEGATQSTGNSSRYVSEDTTHSNVAGHEYWGYKIAEAVRDAVYSMAA